MWRFSTMFDTDWSGASATFAGQLAAYQPLRDQMAQRQLGADIPKPVGFASAIGKVVDAETPPLRVFFGEMPTHLAPQVYQQRLATWDDWKSVALEAEGK